MSGWIKALVALLLFMAALPAGADGRSAAASPRDLIMDMTARFVSALETNREHLRDDPELAHRLVEDIVYPNIDFPRFARWVLGKHWRDASEAERHRFVSEFRDLVGNTYVAAMSSYVDDIISHAKNVSYPAARFKKDGTLASVYSVITLNSGGSVEVSYRVLQKKGAWKVYDVTINGVSLAMTYRRNFATRIGQIGMEAFLDQLSARNRGMRS